MACWVPEPYDLSTNSNLTINFAIDSELRQFCTVVVDVAGATPSATMALEVATALNADPTISSYWNAVAQPQNPRTLGQTSNIVALVSNRPRTGIRAYISNTGAEQQLQFNQKAPIAQLPSYFIRNTIAQKDNYPTEDAILVQLNPASVTYDAAMISAQGQDPTTILADWQLLGGRSTAFEFKSFTYDSSSRVTFLLEYPAGANVGDLARLTQYQYSGSSTNPSQVTEIPYSLTSSDLVTPGYQGFQGFQGFQGSQGYQG